MATKRITDTAFGNTGGGETDALIRSIKAYVGKFSQLERYENTVKEKEKKADDMIASQSKWIAKQAAAMSERERNYYRAECKKQAAKLKAGYRAKVTAHEAQFFGFSTWISSILAYI